MKITFCGGAGEVGASCYLINIEGKNLLLDCGIRMSSSKDNLPDFRLIQENGGVDAIIVSHAHMDHTGSLPAISRQFPNATVYMTHMTKDLTRVLLYDGLKVMERESEIPIYAENHVREMLDRTVCFSPQHEFKLFDDSDITATFYSAGHIAGAAAIYIKSNEGSIFYSGDFSGFRQNSIEGAAIPALRPDVALFESTYGDKLHANRDLEEERLVNSVNDVIEKGGKILVPAFALGRAQEIILILKKAMNRGRLVKCPVYVDGMVRDICRVYNLNPNYLRKDLAKKIFRGNEVFYDDRVTPVENPEQRKEIVESSNPCVIISSSGMLTGGPSQWYAEKLAASENNFIAITGYQDEESPGSKLLALADTDDKGSDAERAIKLLDKEVIFRCQVSKYGLSAHGDKGEILSLAGSLCPRRIFLVHGDPEVINSLGRELQKDVNARIYVPSNGEQYNLEIKNPRKQREAKVFPTMAKAEDLTENNIHELWEFVLEHMGIASNLSLEDIAYIWGHGDTEDIKALLNNTIYFEPDRKRMFLYHAVEKSAVEKLKAPAVMEVNEMLKLVDEYFGPDSGLYKKGARYDEKAALLYFNFPDVAVNKYRDEIRDFEQRTGWRVEVNKNINLSAVNETVYKLLPSDVGIKKISYHAQDGKVTVFTEKEIDGKNFIVQEFLEQTGLTLLINQKEGDGRQLNIRSGENQMEQNQALATIDSHFSDMPHKPYKKSIRFSQNGVKYIELSFISKEVGERYIDKVRELEEIIDYSIIISDSCNQIEIINIAKRLMAENGIQLKKNPSIYLGEMAVRITTAGEVEEEKRQSISKLFHDLTGFDLVW